MKVAENVTPVSQTGSAQEIASEPRIVVIDDDDLSREVLTLIAAEAGFEVESFSSGEDALTTLGAAAKPSAILADIQMPGISGRALAQELRNLCGEGTTLLAMSGSQVAQDQLSGYDAFLLKPFSADALKLACDRSSLQAMADSDDSEVILNEAVFENFARSMPVDRVFELYKLCLADSRKRLTTMQHACEIGDDTAYRGAAHAIKGGCGMVGAVELARLAAQMENCGLGAENVIQLLDHFLVAWVRLERMLDIKAGGVQG